MGSTLGTCQIILGTNLASAIRTSGVNDEINSQYTGSTVGMDHSFDLQILFLLLVPPEYLYYNYPSLINTQAWSVHL